MTPRVLLIGGLDPSGGAGVTADATVVALHGGHPLPVLAATPAQNRHGFRALQPLEPALLRAQLEAALDDGPVDAVKLGLLGTAAAVAEVARALRRLPAAVPVVVDPVFSATAGGIAAPAAAVAAYLAELLPLAALVTPNLPELAALGGGAAGLRARGARAVLVKGGHADGEWACDELHEAHGVTVFHRQRLAIGPVRGTGCALASAIAARLGRGEPLDRACRDAGDWLAARLHALGPPPGDGLPRALRWVDSGSAG